jgi:hypothetical protein
MDSIHKEANGNDSFYFDLPFGANICTDGDAFTAPE